MQFLKEVLSETVVGIPIWIPIALLLGLAFVIFVLLPNLGAVRRIRPGATARAIARRLLDIAFIAVPIVVLLAAMMFVVEHFNGWLLARLVVVPVFAFVVATATITIYRHRAQLYAPDPSRPEPSAVEMNPPWRRIFAGNPTIGAIHISQFALWALVVMWLLPVVVFLSLPFVWPMWFRIVIGLLFLGIALLLTTSGIVEVSGNPPHRAVYMFMGARTDTEFDEGTAFVFPGIERLATVNIIKRDTNIDVEDIRTKDNAHLRARFQIPWIPDRDRLAEFLGSGGEQGVRNLMDDYVKERARDFFIHNIEAREVSRKVFRYERQPDGTLKPKTDDEPRLLEPWEAALDYREDIRGFLISKLVHGMTVQEEEREGVTRIINGEELREELRRGGKQDRFHWGIRILDINISTILPAGKTAEAADRRSQETGERAAELYEIETEALQGAQLKRYLEELGYTIKVEDAYRLLLDYKMVRNKRGFVIPGLPDAIRSAVQAFLERSRREG